MSLIEAALRDQERRFTDLKPLDFAGERPGKFRSQRQKVDQVASEKRFYPCGRKLGANNRSGNCSPCGNRLRVENEKAQRKAAREAKQRDCRKCGTQIFHWNKSGLCNRHMRQSYLKKYKANRRAKARAEA